MFEMRYCMTGWCKRSPREGLQRKARRRRGLWPKAARTWSVKPDRRSQVRERLSECEPGGHGKGGNRDREQKQERETGRERGDGSEGMKKGLQTLPLETPLKLGGPTWA